MTKVASKINFDKSGYYISGLVAIVLLGFWKSYFSELIAGTSGHASIFHFHAVMMSLWMAMLIVQPILIRKKEIHSPQIDREVFFCCYAAAGSFHTADHALRGKSIS